MARQDGRLTVILRNTSQAQRCCVVHDVSSVSRFSEQCPDRRGTQHGGDEATGMVAKARIIDDIAKGFLADLALANAGVAIDAGAQIGL